MEQRPGFSWGALSMGSKGALVTGVLAFIALFLPWFKIGGELFGVPVGDLGSVNGWNGIGVIAGLLVIALLAWEALNVGGALASVAAPKKLITAVLAAGAALFMILRFLIKPELTSYSWGAWVGLILALALAYAAWLNFTEHKTMAGGAMPPPMPPPA